MKQYSQAYFVKQGKIGGDTYAKKYSKKQRSEIARKRWVKIKKGEAITNYIKKTLKNKSPIEGVIMTKKQYRTISKIAKRDGFNFPKAPLDKNAIHRV